MVDRPGRAGPVLGYLQINGSGGYSARDLRDLLAAIEDAYEAASRVERAAYRLAVAEEWLRQWGPPRRYWAADPFFAGELDTSRAGDPLLVTRVVLESPGFWEFLGSLNPLECLRRYLVDRHERKKDRDYRSAAERERLAIENAVASLEVVRQIARLEREFGPEIFSSDAWRQGWIGEIRTPLERLAEFDDRGLINGESARTDVEPPGRPPDRLPPAGP